MKSIIWLAPLFSSLFFISCGPTEDDERIKYLQEEIAYLQSSNDNMLEKMTELSIINREDAASIHTSLQIMQEQQGYITQLSEKIQEKDSINFALVSNLKSSLLDVHDSDVDIEVKGSAVYVSLSDKLLFKTASAQVNKEAYEVLGKVARIINDNFDLKVLVQGHTDDVPIHNKYFSDNWDLSASRALAVVRVLQNRYEVDPSQLTAAGQAEYAPKVDNDSPDNRRINRRTEIILRPDLGQFFDLMTLPDFQSPET